MQSSEPPIVVESCQNTRVTLLCYNICLRILHGWLRKLKGEQRKRSLVTILHESLANMIRSDLSYVIILYLPTDCSWYQKSRYYGRARSSRIIPASTDSNGTIRDICAQAWQEPRRHLPRSNKSRGTATIRMITALCRQFIINVNPTRSNVIQDYKSDESAIPLRISQVTWSIGFGPMHINLSIPENGALEAI